MATLHGWIQGGWFGGLQPPGTEEISLEIPFQSFEI